ncbi:Actin-binding Rho-activating protein [Trichinella pseudospiralis]|uniref:Actin-binding Rho-activating protein n=1 Tax=Trichinella pseudospiralis TaxID=6337 RepID=A0A0V1K6X4_TRIPS|nr:Actin-binding Rho-activating protein [Trichinella pseudospiralis]KRZ42958.1 Actin-binding Rho-activating protein [Trichinella pseudospiralis]
MEVICRRVYGTNKVVLFVDVTGGAVASCLRDHLRRPRLRKQPDTAMETCPGNFAVRSPEMDNSSQTIQQQSTTARPRRKVKSKSTMSVSLAKFQQMTLEAEKAAVKDDVFSPLWKPPKFDRHDPDYGRPKKGSLTEKRGIAAGIVVTLYNQSKLTNNSVHNKHTRRHHISREIIQLCELISEFGARNDDGTTTITFGKLFEIYVYVSDKVVGMLLRARRHKIVDFQGEMLYQRRDEDVPITLLRPIDQVRLLYSSTDDPSWCVAKT